MTIKDPHYLIAEKDKFSDREVGLTHPGNDSFIRICDNGDIEIVAGDAVSIILSAKTRSATITADHIKFITRHEDGLRWNDLSFNEHATTFSEPTFVRFDSTDAIGVYRGVDYFVEDEPNG